MKATATARRQHRACACSRAPW
uniref:Uncharacterized protein n=1 Tax=Arundo donax TaxID=35708 RepID=A0A0A9EV61_ARUDO